MAQGQKLFPRMKGSVCNMPTPLPAKEQKIWRGLVNLIHKGHCARGKEAYDKHECQGRITIGRGTVDLQCPLCGDARRLFEEKPPTEAEG